jgi:ribosomal protein S12 methylthiotransferase accessory factor
MRVLPCVAWSGCWRTVPSLVDVREPAAKAAGSFDRTCTPEETLAHEGAIRARYGITRIAEITHLDRIGIPVFSAIVPDSYESISVYNGKGITPAAARAGALMEAAERQALFASCLPVRTLAAEHLDDAMRSLVRAPGSVAVVEGYDLLAERAIDVPAKTSSSNGLASGNNQIEAIYHALCELIERHVWSVAHAIAHERPRALIARFAGGRVALPNFIDDPVATEYAVPTGSPDVDALLDRIAAAGLAVRLRAVELRPLPILFIATISGDEGGASRSHSGFGCSLSPRHAAMRAMTEAAQGRLADIHAVREDLVHAVGDGDDRHRRRTAVPSGTWYFDAPARASSLDRVTDRASGDVATDVDTVLRALRAAGFRRAAIVDVSPPDLPIAVVRAVVPGLESSIVDGTIGPLIARILDVSCDLDTMDSIIR